MKKIKPDIIMLSTAGPDRPGPSHNKPGFGLELASRGGFTHFVGWPDQEAVGLVIHIPIPSVLRSG